jgi:hypothetical protein
MRSAASSSVQEVANERYKKKNQEDKEENLRDPCRGHGDSCEAEHCRDERDNEKSQCPT